jgi:hypothetical protein
MRFKENRQVAPAVLLLKRLMKNARSNPSEFAVISVSGVSIAHRVEDCPNPCGCLADRVEMSWQTVLTALTVLTVLARLSTPSLS